MTCLRLNGKRVDIRVSKDRRSRFRWLTPQRFCREIILPTALPGQVVPEPVLITGRIDRWTGEGRNIGPLICPPRRISWRGIRPRRHRAVRHTIRCRKHSQRAAHLVWISVGGHSRWLGCGRANACQRQISTRKCRQPVTCPHQSFPDYERRELGTYASPVSAPGSPFSAS